MLVLSRKIDEVITVGEVRITVVGIKGNTVQLRVDAPKGVRIERQGRVAKPSAKLARK